MTLDFVLKKDFQINFNDIIILLKLNFGQNHKIDIIFLSFYESQSISFQIMDQLAIFISNCFVLIIKD